jgi:hypothetical protein
MASLPWVDEPLVMFDTDDIAESRQTLIDAGAVGLGEIADRSKLGLRQSLPTAW